MVESYLLTARRFHPAILGKTDGRLTSWTPRCSARQGNYRQTHFKENPDERSHR